MFGTRQSRAEEENSSHSNVSALCDQETHTANVCLVQPSLFFSFACCAAGDCAPQSWTLEHDPEECTRIRFTCAQPYEYWRDSDCGCGCKPINRGESLILPMVPSRSVLHSLCCGCIPDATCCITGETVSADAPCKWNSSAAFKCDNSDKCCMTSSTCQATINNAPSSALCPPFFLWRCV